MLKKIITAVCLSSMTLMGYAAPSSQSHQSANSSHHQSQKQFSQSQVKAIHGIIHDYLLDNPRLVVKVLQKLRKQEREQMEHQAIQAIHQHYQTIFENPHSPVLGNPKGDVTLVEFFDYQCPHCRAMTSAVKNLINDNQQLRVVMKEFPIFPGSKYASKAALASVKQDKYQAFHHKLMELNKPFKKDKIIKAAKDVGLDIQQLKQDMKSDTIAKELKTNLQLAQDLDLAGTPAFIIQDNHDKDKTFFVPGQTSESNLQKLIDKATK